MKIELIDDCRQWYKRWTTWLAALIAPVFAYVLANPTVLLGVIDRLPEPWKTLSAIGAGALLFVVPVLTAQLKQKNLTKPDA